MTFSLLYAFTLLFLQVVVLVFNEKLFNFFWGGGIRSANMMTIITFVFCVVAAIPLSLLVWCVL